MRALADLYPARLEPWPPEVPQRRVRAVITDEWAAVAWEGADRTVQVHHLPAPEPGAVTAEGGVTGGVGIRRGSGCKCGSRTVQNASVASLAPPQEQPQEQADDD